MTNRSKKTRRDLHAAINELTRAEVAAIVRKEYPPAKGKGIDALAKQGYSGGA